MANYAVIDVGSNSIRLVVYSVPNDNQKAYRRSDFSSLANDKVMAGLAAYVSEGVFTPAGIKKATSTIKSHLKHASYFKCKRIDVFATAVLRNAQNSAEAIEAIEKSAGCKINLISGEDEALLGFAGASSETLIKNGVTVDIGGGSTEVIAGRAGSRPDRSHSFNIGCRRVTEKFFAADPPGAGELERARAWVEEGMRPYFDELRGAGFAPERLVAVAGTAVSIHERMEVYDTSRVHKAVITRPMLDGVADQLERVPLAQRERIVGLDPGRAPVIVAGMVILQTVLDLAGVDSFTVSESDILHGIILDEAAR